MILKQVRDRNVYLVKNKQRKSTKNVLFPEKPLNQATVSLYFDNWSPYHLDLIADEIRSGTFSTGLLPHDLTPYSRGLALRSVSSKETKKSSGLIAWTLLENKIQLGKWIDTFY